MATPTVAPFTAHFDPEGIADLRARLGNTRWPDAQTAPGWDQGVPLDYARELAGYWAQDYDFTRVPRLLGQWQQLRVTLHEDGQDYAIHCLHQRSPRPDARALILTHGWPGSVLEFQNVIAALADPAAQGHPEAPAFHVIVPSLPGFGFSSQPTRAGTSVERIADLWDQLAQALGYPHYFAQGGDWGSMVSSCLAMRHPARCRGIHLNMILAAPDPDTFGELTADEAQALAAMGHHAKWDSAYARQQSTRPQTLGYALADSPVGQLCWIVEKFQAWSDCEREGQTVPEGAISRDEMLDTVSLYWLTNSATSSARLYWESYHDPDLSPIGVPVGATRLPKEIFLSSERWARKRFGDLRYWSEPAVGGHFLALEQPALFVEELRRCFATMPDQE